MEFLRRIAPGLRGPNERLDSEYQRLMGNDDEDHLIEVEREENQVPSSLDFKDVANMILPPWRMAEYPQSQVAFSNSGYYWETLIVILIAYTAWAIPFEMGFLQSLSSTPVLLMVDVAVAVIFMCDVFIIYTRWSIWALVEIFASLPWQTFAHFLWRGNYLLISFSGVLQLVKLWRINRYFTRLEEQISHGYFWVRFTRLLCVIFFVTHCGGCVYYLLAEIYADEGKTWISTWNPHFKETSILTRYGLSLYFSFATISTVGYGDIHPANPTEMVYTFLFMMFNYVLGGAYLSSNLSSLGQRSEHTIEFRKKIEAVSEFAHLNKLPSSLRDLMLAYISLKYKEHIFNEEELIEGLSRSIYQNLFVPTAQSTYLFQGVSKETLMDLLANMKGEYMPPGENILTQNEKSSEVFIIMRGEVEVLDMDKVLKTLRRNEIFGEISGFCMKPQRFTCRSKTLTQLLILKNDDLLQTKNDDKLQMIRNILQHFKQFVDLVSTTPEAGASSSGNDTPFAVELLAAASTKNATFLQELYEADILTAAYAMLDMQNEGAAEEKDIFDEVVNIYIKTLVRRDNKGVVADNIRPLIQRVEDVMPIMLQELASSEATNRMGAVDCVVEMCISIRDANKPIYHDILTQLHRLCEESEAPVRDSADDALARLTLTR